MGNISIQNDTTPVNSGDLLFLLLVQRHGYGRPVDRVRFRLEASRPQKLPQVVACDTPDPPRSVATELSPPQPLPDRLRGNSQLLSNLARRPPQLAHVPADSPLAPRRYEETKRACAQQCSGGWLRVQPSPTQKGRERDVSLNGAGAGLPTSPPSRGVRNRSALVTTLPRVSICQHDMLKWCVAHLSVTGSITGPGSRLHLLLLTVGAVAGVG